MGFKQQLKRAFKYIVKGVPNNYLTVNTYTVAPNETMKGKHILITGGSSGIGFFAAKKCVAEGANVIITGRNEEKLKKAAVEIGKNCTYLKHDITDIESLSSLFKNAEKMFGCKIDSLVSNAGVSFHEGSFRNVTPEGWDAQMDTNLKGNYFIVKEFVKYLESKDDTSGNIVVITSERSMRADDIPYGLTKAATNSFIKGIARKVISENIRINGVGPGVTESNMTGFRETKICMPSGSRAKEYSCLRKWQRLSVFCFPMCRRAFRAKLSFATKQDMFQHGNMILIPYNNL